MTEKMHRIVAEFKKHNCEDMAAEVFGLDRTIHYDAVIFAPGWTPDKMMLDSYAELIPMRHRASSKTWLLKKDGLVIPYIFTSSGAGNLIDCMAIAAELRTELLLFVGSVGALVPELALGDMITPSYCIEGGIAGEYLNPRLADAEVFKRVTPHCEGFISRVIKEAEEKGIHITKEPIYCTDSIALEYIHLEEIKALGAKAIEMETAAFYRMAKELELPAIALLLVSDNSATGIPLAGRTDEQNERYYDMRSRVLPELIFDLASEGWRVKAVNKR